MIAPGVQSPEGVLDEVEDNGDGAIPLGGELIVVGSEQLGEKGRILDEGTLHDLVGVIIDKGDLEGVAVGDHGCQADQSQPEPFFFKNPKH